MKGEITTHAYRLLPGDDLRLSIESFVKEIILKPVGLPVVSEALQIILFVLQINPKQLQAMVTLK